jgi:hypothetical protein
MENNNITELFNNYEVQKYIKQLVHPIGQTVYNEVYVYIWFICLYNVFLFVILLMNLFLLMKLTSQNGPKVCDVQLG